MAKEDVPIVVYSRGTPGIDVFCYRCHGQIRTGDKYVAIGHGRHSIRRRMHWRCLSQQERRKLTQSEIPGGADKGKMGGDEII